MGDKKMKHENDISKDDLMKAYMLVVNAPLLSKEDKQRANEVLEMRPKVRDLIQLLDIPLQSLQTNYSQIAKQVDVTQFLLSHKFDVSEEDWDKAESKVEKINKEQREKLAKAYVDKLKKVAKGQEAGIDDQGNSKIIPFKGIKKGSSK